MLIGSEKSAMTTSRVEGNEVVKAIDFNYGFDSLILNITKFSKMIFEANKNFVIGGKVISGNGLNVKINPVLGVNIQTQELFGITELSDNIAIQSGATDRIDLLEVRGVVETFDNQQRAFNDLDTDVITYQPIDTKNMLKLECLVKQGTEGLCPDTDSGYVKLAEIHYKANSDTIEDEDIYNITSDVPDVINEDWTNEKDVTYNMGYISDVNQRFRQEHNEDGSHKENIITTKELNIGISESQISALVLPVGMALDIGKSKTLATSSIADVLDNITNVTKELFENYLKFGKFNFNGELNISDSLDSESTALSKSLSIGTDTTEDDERYAYIKINGTEIIRIYESGVITDSTSETTYKYITEAISIEIWKYIRDADNSLVKRIKWLEDNADPTASSNIVLSKFEVSGLEIKAATNSSSTDITLAGQQIIDGISCGAGDLVLVKNQDSNPELNGIYQVTTSGIWQRVSDTLTRKFFYIISGNENGGYSFYTKKDSYEVGTDEIEFLKTIYAVAPRANTVVLRDKDGNIADSDLTLSKTSKHPLQNKVITNNLSTYICDTAANENPVILLDGVNTLFDGYTCRVLFKNGHVDVVANTKMLLNGKPIYAEKQGDIIPLSSHEINGNGSYVFCNSNKILELTYLSYLNENNGGWMIIGNPTVVSGVEDEEDDIRYEIKSDGLISQSGIFIPSKGGSNQYISFVLQYASKPCMKCTSVNTGSYIAGGAGYPSTEGAFRNSSCRGGTLNRADANGFYVDYADSAYNYHWQAIGY